MTNRLRTTVAATDVAVTVLLRQRGFEKVSRGRYISQLPHGLFATFTVTTKPVPASEGAGIDVYPLIGIGHSRIAEVASELVAEAPSNRASVSVGLGYLNPKASWTAYRVESQQGAERSVAAIFQDFDAYGVPFLARHTSIEDLVESMCELVASNLVAQDLPIAYCLIEQGHKAREYVAGYIGHHPPRFLQTYYVPFLKRLRETLLPASAHSDSALGTELVLAVRKILPIDLTLNEVLAFWRSFVAEVETGCDRSFLEYQNAIGLRELLASVVADVPLLNRALRAELLVLDSAFRSATDEATDDASAMGPAWWWRRIPIRPGPRLQRSMHLREIAGPSAVQANRLPN